MTDKSEYILFMEKISDMILAIAWKTCDCSVYIKKNYYIKLEDIIPEIRDLIHEVNIERYKYIKEDIK